MKAFLTHLAVQGKVAASTQNQALNAIVFLYRLRHPDRAGALGQKDVSTTSIDGEGSR